MRVHYWPLVLVALFLIVPLARSQTPHWYFFSCAPHQSAGTGVPVEIPGLMNHGIKLKANNWNLYLEATPSVPVWGLKNLVVRSSAGPPWSYTYERFFSSQALPLPPVQPGVPSLQFELEVPVTGYTVPTGDGQLHGFYSADDMAYPDNVRWHFGGNPNFTFEFFGWLKLIHPSPPPGPDIEYVSDDGVTAIFRYRNAVVVNGQEVNFSSAWQNFSVPVANNYASALALGARFGDTAFAEMTVSPPVKVKVVPYPGIVSALVTHKSQTWLITAPTEIEVNQFQPTEFRCGVRFKLEETASGWLLYLYPDVVPNATGMVPADEVLAGGSEQEALTYVGQSDGVSVFAGSTGAVGVDGAGNTYRQETPGGPLVRQETASGENATQGAADNQGVTPQETEGFGDIDTARSSALDAIGAFSQSAVNPSSVIGTASDPVTSLPFPYPRTFSEMASGNWQGQFLIVLAGSPPGVPHVDLRGFLSILRDLLGGFLVLGTLWGLWKGGV